MSNNQLHGKTFEDVLKGCGAFRGASDVARSHTSNFDIEAQFDRVMGLPTSVKTTKSNTACLADARTFWRLTADQPFRLLVGRYAQFCNSKIFGEVFELIIDGSRTDLLLGDLSYNEVADFHEQIRAIPFGGQEAGRKAAKARKKELMPRTGIIQLNPKIDSKRQRRLQCSVNLKRLLEEMPDKSKLHEFYYGDLCFPLRLMGGERVFSS